MLSPRHEHPGAILNDMGMVMRWYASGGYRLQFESGLIFALMSRPFLEWQIRRRVVPVLSSIVWGLFYLTNIYNAAKAAEKANLFRLNKYYNAILEKFRFVLKDDAYFLNVQLKF